MCMVEDADFATMFADSVVTARKQHKCSECFRVIEPGEKYRKYFGKGVDGTFHGKTCIHCEVLMEWLQQNCGGYLFEGVLEDFQEHASDYQRMDLWRLTAMARNQWRSVRKNILLPVQKCPAPLSGRDAQHLAHH